MEPPDDGQLFEVWVDVFELLLTVAVDAVPSGEGPCVPLSLALLTCITTSSLLAPPFDPHAERIIRLRNTPWRCLLQ